MDLQKVQAAVAAHDIKTAIGELKNIDSTLGVVKVSDLAAAVDAVLLEVEVGEAVNRNDFEEVARLQNSRA